VENAQRAADIAKSNSLAVYNLSFQICHSYLNVGEAAFRKRHLPPSNTCLRSRRFTSQPPFPRPPVRPNGSFRGLPQKANSWQRYRGIIDFHLINHPALVRQVMRETHRDFGAPALGPALPLGYLERLILKTGFSLIASHLQMWPERACSRVS
jgi:hypothetical protein